MPTICRGIVILGVMLTGWVSIFSKSDIIFSAAVFAWVSSATIVSKSDILVSAVLIVVRCSFIVF